MNPLHDKAALTAYFDQEAGGWSDRYRHNRHFRERLDTVLAWVQGFASPGASLLDYGCGSGVLLMQLAKEGYKMTGVDASQGMLAEASKALMCEGLSAERLELADAHFRGNWCNRDYDGVTCLGVLEYLERPEELLEALAGTIRPGGFLILSFPNRQSWLRRFESLVFRHPRFFRPFRSFRHLTGPDSYLHYQRNQLDLSLINRQLAEKGLRPFRLRCHVAPGPLGFLHAHPRVGMTMIAGFIRPAIDPEPDADWGALPEN